VRLDDYRLRPCRQRYPRCKVTHFSAGPDGLPVLRILASHRCRPDHLGSAQWLCDQWHAPLWRSAAEYGCALNARQLTSALGEVLTHLHSLWHDEILIREFDDKGRFRFRTA
jgi:hypothetical protein